jgi:hypothetical protein
MIALKEWFFDAFRGILRAFLREFSKNVSTLGGLPRRAEL